MKPENELTYASDSSGPGMVAPGQAQALISFVLALHLTAPHPAPHTTPAILSLTPQS